MKFYKCNDCDSIVMEMSHGPKTCSVPSKVLLMPQTGEEAAKTEKHTPVLAKQGSSIQLTVGSVLHPMTAEHHIQWIFVQTKNGGMLRQLLPTDAPKAEFDLDADEIVDVYAYCNLHGLWKA